MKAYFWWKIMEAKNTATSFKRKEKKNCQIRIQKSTKMSFKNIGKVKKI